MKTILRQAFLVCSGLVVLVALALQLSGAGIRPTHSGAPYGALVDTPAFSIPFVTSPNGLYYSFGANFGIHSGATKGIDPSLGEVEYPPFPPCCACMMFVTTGGNSILDLRPYTSPSQIDTFTVGVSAESLSYPIVFSWPDLHSYYGGSVRLKSDLSGSVFDIDMKGKTSFTLMSGPFIPNDGGPPPVKPVLVMYIVAEGPLAGTSMPVVSTYGIGNGGFQALVNAPTGGAAFPSSVRRIAAGTTSVWFEYGPTKTYGSSSTPQSVTSGTSLNVTQPFDPSSLPLNTRIHFRSVAQNGLGTFYGGDRVVSNGTPPPEVADSSGSVMYRTATYRDWADAKDKKGNRVAIKAKPDKADFAFTLLAPTVPSPAPALVLKFSGTVSPITIWQDTLRSLALFQSAGESKSLGPVSGIVSGTTILVEGRSLTGKLAKFTYAWDFPKNKIKGTVLSYIKNDLLLPMPDLENVGQEIYGGVSQTPVVITVGVNGDPKGAHTVYHTKFTDVMKSLIKVTKGVGLYHTAPARWLDHFDNGKQKAILTRQKGLPPDKHNNVLFAEALTLKLNVAASDSGLFPEGLGDLFYSNSTPFDGMSIREIIAQVDSFMGRPPAPPEVVTDSSIYLKVVQDINNAFAGPMDTSSWSGGKVICTGVKKLADVPFLYAGVTAAPTTDVVREPASEQNQKPLSFTLNQNFPNPFNPTTTISFNLPEDALVTVQVFNILGQVVATPANQGAFTAGYNEVRFSGMQLASGVYYYRIQAQDITNRSVVFSAVRKMLLLK